MFIGTQNVKPAAFVDDLINPNRTVSDIIESNENAKHFEKIKILTLKADKCKSLYINYGKEQCIDLDIRSETAEKIDVVKYPGDIFSSKGNNNDLIESRVKTGKQRFRIIQAFCKEIALGNYEIQIMLQLYESIFLSTVLFNCQSWTNLRNTHIESLQTLQKEYLKQTMCVPYSTPNKGTLLELGILPIYDVINCRKLLFLHHILNLMEDDPVLKLYKEQNKLPFEKNWVNEVSRL